MDRSRRRISPKISWLRVTDVGGLTDFDTASIDINNVAPTIALIGLAYTWREKAHVRLTFLSANIPSRVSHWLRVVTLVLALGFTVLDVADNSGARRLMCIALL